MPAVRKKKGKQKEGILLPTNASVEELKRLHTYLDRIYYDPSSGGAYGSPGALLNEVKRRNYYRNVGKKRVTTYLERQLPYTVYRPAQKPKHTPIVRVSNIGGQFDMDLMDVTRQQSANDGTKFLLTAIDVFSKYAYVEPLHTKGGREVAAATLRIFTKQQPQRVCTDCGSEF